MKSSLLFFLPIFLFAFPHPDKIQKGFEKQIFVDSGHFGHNFDGNTDEWPDGSFTKDEESGISYALDNDSKYLYVAMRIADIREQIKLMRMGMRLFIDLKAKKKENTGVEFPLKKDPSETGNNSNTRPAERSEGDNTEEHRPDPKAMRASLMMNLIYLRIFGFEGQDEIKDQGLMMPNTVNVEFSWDANDLMHIEYRIPLTMVDDIKSLNNKEVSIGWKIFGRDLPSSGGSGMPTGSGGGRRGGGFSGRPVTTNNSATKTDNSARQESFEKMMREQNFWTKYQISFN